MVLYKINSQQVDMPLHSTHYSDNKSEMVSMLWSSSKYQFDCLWSNLGLVLNWLFTVRVTVRVVVFNSHFQQHFIYIMAVSFIGGGNRSARRKRPTCLKSLTNFYHIMLYGGHLAWVGFELTTSMVIGIDCKGSYKSNYHAFTTRTPPAVYSRWVRIKSDI